MAPRVRFPEIEGPLHYANAFQAAIGVDDFFVTIGYLIPPEIRVQEDIDSIAASPLIHLAISRENMKQFIKLLQDQYEMQSSFCEKESE